MTEAQEPAAPQHAEHAPGPPWWGWGPARALPDDVRTLLRETLGASGAARPRVAESEVRMREPALPDAARTAFTAAVGAANVRDDRATRLRHAGGKSTTDLLARRAGQADDAPDAVLRPGDHDEVRAVLDAAARHAVAVVPFGGGTSVVGGVEPLRGRFGAVVALDLARLDALLAVDPVDRTATLQAGVGAPEAERLLARHGYTLGHVPQSFEHATIGGFAATRSAGQASAGYGRFDEMVVALRAATPRGTLDLGRAPASAAGPDLRHLLLGSEGTLGVLTEVTVRVWPCPDRIVEEHWTFPDFPSGAAALRRLVQLGMSPAVLRLSDETETFVNAAIAGADAAGCRVVTRYEGTTETVDARRTIARRVLADAGGVPDDSPSGAASFERGRFDAPYLRDALLDAGVLAETLETATSWSRLADVHTAVRDALDAALSAPGAPAVVLGHVSHVYPDGAALYFTAVCAQADDPVAQWRAAKRAAAAAIAAAGATITHHHAVGTDHLPWMPTEIGDLGVELLRSVKHTLDPTGILNPGKLAP